MKAVILKAFGGIENLDITEVPKPDIQPDEVLVRTKAIAINPVDIKTRQGFAQAQYLRKDYPMILGWDVSGIITEIGAKVQDYQVGDEVFGLIRFPGSGRTYAEYVVAPAAQLARKPRNISHEEAAAASLSGLTAWKALVTLGKVKPGDRVLIHGASGGVGNYAVQIAKYFGSWVIGTASGTNKDFVLHLGADQVIDYQTQRFEEIVKNVDIVLDSVGGKNFDRSLEVLKPGGIIISLPSDKAEENRKIAEINRVTHYYQMLVESNGEVMRKTAELLQQERLRSYIFKTFSFDRIPEAQIQVETGKTVGKVVVKV